jgi:signal transduction histidine kinase
MRSVIEIIASLNTAIYVFLAAVAYRHFQRGHGDASRWAACALGAIGLAAILGRVILIAPGTTVVLTRIELGILLLYPFLLFRFTNAFERVSPLALRLSEALTLITLIFTFAVPHFPRPNEPWSLVFTIYLVIYLFHWATLSSISATRLWMAGKNQPGVSRQRMRWLSIAAFILTAVLLIAGSIKGQYDVGHLVIGLMTTAAGVAFFLALAPPAILRIFWRREEQAQIQKAMVSLMGAKTQEDVAQVVTEPVARIVGSNASALLSSDGRVLGSYGLSEELHLTLVTKRAPNTKEEAYEITLPGGVLYVWKSRYAPFFGQEERRLLDVLASVTSLALERARLNSRERHFVSYAAHELRTPVTSVMGALQTLEQRESELSPAVVKALRETSLSQAQRLVDLVDQLLDLSRLDSQTVRIEPKPLLLKTRVEEIVSAIDAGYEDKIIIDIPEDLEACVDSVAVDHIITNLVANGFRYGESPITIRARVEGEMSIIEVEDSGAGVDSDFLPHLFERFSRASSAQKVSGTGLGLAISRAYSLAHGGDISYREASPHGACFIVGLRANPEEYSSDIIL